VGEVDNSYDSEDERNPDPEQRVDAADQETTEEILKKTVKGFHDLKGQ